MGDGEYSWGRVWTNDLSTNGGVTFYDARIGRQWVLGFLEDIWTGRQVNVEWYVVLNNKDAGTVAVNTYDDQWAGGVATKGYYTLIGETGITNAMTNETQAGWDVSGNVWTAEADIPNWVNEPSVGTTNIRGQELELYNGMNAAITWYFNFGTN